MTSRKLTTAALALGAGLFLSACAETDDTATTQTDNETETATTTETTATTQETGATETTATTATTEQDGDAQTGDDPVFAAIDAALAAYSDGIVVTVDREDDSETYDIDVVQGEQVLELEVGADGTVREDEREGDDDDVAKAQAATVTAADAIRQALEQHPDGVLDEAELDEDDGVLRWEINLDDADRNDLAEVNISAN